MWSWEVGENDLYYEPAPWLRTGPVTDLDSKAKFDFKQFNPEYFKRLLSRVITARNKGIYVSVMPFQGWSIYSYGCYSGRTVAPATDTGNHLSSQHIQSFQTTTKNTERMVIINIVDEAYLIKTIPIQVKWEEKHKLSAWNQTAAKLSGPNRCAGMGVD